MKIGTSGPLVNPGFTQGSVIFAGVGGVQTEDNANLFFNDASNFFGVGTNAPTVTLTVKGPAIVVASSSASLSAPLITGASLMAAGDGGAQSNTVLRNRLIFMVDSNTDYGTYLGSYNRNGTAAGLYGVIGTRGNGTDTPTLFFNQGLAMFSNKTDLSTLPTPLALNHVDGTFFASTYVAPVKIGTGAAVDEELQVNTTTVAAGTAGTKEMMIFFRPIQGAVSYPQAATIALGTYSTNSAGNGFGPDTRLDFKLKSLSADDSVTDLFVLTLTDRGGGSLGVATIDPQARLHLPAGTTTAGTAPLRFTISGSDALATPVAGVVETDKDDSDNLFFTITTGAARKEFVLADPSGGLTSTRIPIATTNGRLTDDALFTWNTGASGLNGLAIINEQTRTFGVGDVDSPLFFRPSVELSTTDFTIFSFGADDLVGFGGYPFRLYWDSVSLMFDDGNTGPVPFTITGAFTANDTSDLVGAVAIRDKVTIYNNVATEGYGIPAIVDNIALTGQVANIASTNFTNAGTVGTYRVSCYMVCTTADAAAGTVTLNIAYNDGTAARTTIGAVVALTATNASSTSSFLRLGSGSVSYSVTIAGAYMTAVYSLYVTVERLS